MRFAGLEKKSYFGEIDLFDRKEVIYILIHKFTYRRENKIAVT